MFEYKSKAVLSRAAFAKRFGFWLLITLALMGLSLLIGVVGYHSFEPLSWLDSFLNASMILGGMGEVAPLQTDAGKIFAALYALYSCVFTIFCGGLLLAPIFHRILHIFHAEK